MSNKKKKNTKNNVDDDDKKKKSYLDITRKKRIKNLKTIILPIIAAIVIIAGISLYVFSQNTLSVAGFGPLGSAHEHAAFLVKVNGQNIDFSQPQYQVQSDYIHVENGDGTTLHRHATNVTFVDFLKSVKMDIDKKNNCLTFTNGTEYCDDENNKLRTFINGNSTGSISDYVLNNDDRLLVIYGNETDEQIANALDELNRIEIQYN
ncbi:MAG TPA: hypothetical protein VFC05_15040 [Nitrososphaeraceae archaeon]|jgi:hypothetical protein|nr:hypothetical protein [Nitrososphaeraceae archaeon]